MFFRKKFHSVQCNEARYWRNTEITICFGSHVKQLYHAIGSLQTSSGIYLYSSYYPISFLQCGYIHKEKTTLTHAVTDADSQNAFRCHLWSLLSKNACVCTDIACKSDGFKFFEKIYFEIPLQEYGHRVLHRSYSQVEIFTQFYRNMRVQCAKDRLLLKSWVFQWNEASRSIYWWPASVVALFCSSFLGLQHPSSLNTTGPVLLKKSIS
jgi:hypothetical protein